jgi:uncharacterized delta-60 repeat protein
MRKLLLCLLLIISHLLTYAQPGANDPTFNTFDDGTFGSGYGFDGSVKATVIESDGKIVAGGDFTSYHGINASKITRLNTDGSLDSSFGIGTGFNGTVSSIEIQTDGKILIGGSFSSFNGVSTNSIARLNTDGTLDMSFIVGTGFNGSINHLTIQADGKVLVCGLFSSYNGINSKFIARLNSDGTYDASFITGTGFNFSASSIAAQTDGKIIVVGSFTDYNGNSVNKIVRLNSDGSIDGSYITGTGFNYGVTGIILQPDGKAIIYGVFTDYNGNSANRMVRLNTDGTIDLSFSSGTGISGANFAAKVQADGKIILAGYLSHYNGTTIPQITRLNTDGTIDPTLNCGSGFNYEVTSFAIQSNGKIVLFGSFTNFNNIARQYTARLNTDGSLDVGFNPHPGFNNLVYASAIQADGKIIVGGGFTQYNGTVRNYLARLNFDGTLDSNFNTGVGFNAGVNAIAVQPDGKIIVAGDFTSFNGVSMFNIARLNSDGTIDGTFTSGLGFNGGVYTNALAIQSDGKIIAGGPFTSFNGTTVNRIARLNSDGTLDITFNTGTGFNSTVYSLAVQTDGKINVGGSFTSFNGSSINRICRLNSNGAIDPTFTIGTGMNNIVASVTAQADGKIIASGYFTSYNGTTTNGMVRLNSDGTVDGTFITGTGFAGPPIITKLQADGKIIAGGGFTLYNGISANRIIRLNTDGTLDASFNIGTGFDNSVVSLSIQPDERIVVVGIFFNYNGINRNKIARILNCYPTTGTAVITSCSPITWIDGLTYSSSNNTATYTIPNGSRGGCDSTVTLNLTILQPTASTDAITTCNDITWIDGNTYSASNNTATFVLPNAAGCDSTITLNYTKLAATAGTDAISSCEDYTWIDGVTYSASNNTATYVLTNAAGCDSTVTLNLTIATAIDVTTNTSAETITANATGATYQWIDCDNSNIPIAGETNASFTAIANGNYAVVVTQGLCSDTSDCVSIVSVGIKNTNINNVISILPNPNNGSFTIKAPIRGNYNIVNELGQILHSIELNNTNNYSVSMCNLATGVYFVIGTENNFRSKIVVTK